MGTLSKTKIQYYAIRVAGGIIVVIIGYFILNGFNTNTSNTSEQPQKFKGSENLNVGTSSNSLNDLSSNKTDIYKKVKKNRNAVKEENAKGFGSLELEESDMNSKNTADQIRNQLRDLEERKGKNNNRKTRKPISVTNTSNNKVEHSRSNVIVDNVETQIEEKDFKKSTQEEFENFFENNRKTEKNRKEKILPKSIEVLAAVNYDQVIMKNSRIELILKEPLSIDGKKIPRNTYIYGICNFSNQRLYIQVSKINNIPITLNAYDYQDGNKGIYVDPETLSMEVKKESTEEGLDEVDVNGVPVGGAIKKIFEKKAKKDKIYLLNNYLMILKTK